MLGTRGAPLRLLMIGLLAVMSTGCLRAYQDLTLHQDDTVDGTIVFAVDKDLLELSGQSVDDFMGEVTGDNAGIPAGIEFETEPYDEDDFVGEKFTFTGAPLEQFGGSGTAEELSIKREGDTFVVQGTFDATGDEFDPSSVPGGEGLLDTFDVRVSVTFPGEVTSHNGELDGTTVRWKLELGQVNEIEAVGSAIGTGDGGGGGGAGGETLVWVLLGIAVVAGIALVVLLVVSRRKTAASAGPLPGEPIPGNAPSGDAAPGDTSEMETATAPVPGVPPADAPPTPVPVPPPAPIPVEDGPGSAAPSATEPLAPDPVEPDPERSGPDGGGPPTD